MAISRQTIKGLEIVDYELAKLAKQIGFDYPTFHSYHNQMLRFNPLANHNKQKHFISAPFLSQLQGWLRDKKLMEIFIINHKYNYNDKKYYYKIKNSHVVYGNDKYITGSATYNEMLSNALKIEIKKLIRLKKDNEKYNY